MIQLSQKSVQPLGPAGAPWVIAYEDGSLVPDVCAFEKKADAESALIGLESGSLSQ